MATAFEIDLGEMADLARRYLATGAYQSIDDVVQEGLRALEREQAAFDAMVASAEFQDMMHQKVQEALDDPRPPIPIDEAFAELDRRIAARRARKVRDVAAE